MRVTGCCCACQVRETLKDLRSRADSGKTAGMRPLEVCACFSSSLTLGLPSLIQALDDQPRQMHELKGSTQTSSFLEFWH